MTLFTQFLDNAIRLNTLDKPQGKTKKIVFVDDIPDITTDNIKQRFHNCLRSCLESTVPFLLVLVVSDASMERSSTCSSNFGERLNRLTDIIPKEFEEDRRVRHIK